MPPVKSYRRKSSQRHQIQRTSLTLRRFILVSGILGATVIGLWGYMHSSELATQTFKAFEKNMARLGFRLEDVVVVGRMRTDKTHILNLLELGRGKSLFGINLAQAKENLESISWIKTATIERKLPHTLSVHIVEKIPVSLWQHKGKVHLMDRDGDLVEVKDPSQYKNLLIVTGEKAPQHIDELLTFLSKVPEIKQRITRATYLRSARWDVILDGNVNVKLPEKNPEEALTYLLTLEKKHHFVNEDILIVDMRIPGQLILRLRPEAVKKQKSVAKHA